MFEDGSTASLDHETSRIVEDFTHVTEVLMAKLNADEVGEGLAETKRKFEDLYKKLPEIADQLIKKYRFALRIFELDPGQIKLFMVGGRIKGKPLKADSDIDLIFVVENPSQSAEGSGSITSANYKTQLNILYKISCDVRESLQTICSSHGVKNLFHICNYGTLESSLSPESSLLIGSE